MHQGSGVIDLGDGLVFKIPMKGLSNDLRIKGAIYGVSEEPDYVMDSEYRENPGSNDGCRFIYVTGTISEQ